VFNHNACRAFTGSLLCERKNSNVSKQYIADNTGKTKLGRMRIALISVALGTNGIDTNISTPADKMEHTPAYGVLSIAN
jgi:hypothetical protein